MTPPFKPEKEILRTFSIDPKTSALIDTLSKEKGLYRSQIVELGVKVLAREFAIQGKLAKDKPELVRHGS